MMRAVPPSLFYPWAVLALACLPAVAQEVVQVTQVLPFANKGTVVSLGSGEAVPPAISSSSSGTAEAKITSASTATAPKIVAAGSKVVTGADGTSSLALGSTGTARMGSSSEVKVPDTTEKGHSLELLKGNLFLNIRGEELKKRGAAEFRLKTPAALLAVKGTRFFTLSENGTDTIGVHEGSVMVTEPVSGKSAVLEARSVVSASPGSLGETREMNDAEKNLAAEYAAADLVRSSVPFSIKSPVPNTKRLQVLLFQNGKAAIMGEESSDRVQYGASLDPKLGPCLDWRVLKAGRNSIPVSPQLTQDGVVRYQWTAREPGAGYQCYFDYGGHSGLNYADENYSRLNRLVNPPASSTQPKGRLVALQFRVRSTNVSSAYLVPSLAAGFNPGFRVNLSTILASTAGWTEVLVPALESRDGEFMLPYSHILFVGAYFKQAVPTAKSITVEFSDFTLLNMPP